MRVKGSQGVKPIECINPPKDRWAVRWDIQSDEENGCSYEEQIFDHKPSIEDIKELILGWCNRKIETQIIEEFVWNGMLVWLSIENQMNIHSAYQLAAQSNGATLPTLKLGTTEEPVYHTFQSIEELRDFYFGCLGHIQDARAEGWAAKDSLDFEPYEIS